MVLDGTQTVLLLIHSSDLDVICYGHHYVDYEASIYIIILMIYDIKCIYYIFCYVFSTTSFSYWFKFLNMISCICVMYLERLVKMSVRCLHVDHNCQIGAMTLLWKKILFYFFKFSFLSSYFSSLPSKGSKSLIAGHITHRENSFAYWFNYCTLLMVKSFVNQLLLL